MSKSQQKRLKTQKTINQCDGCRRGLPVKNGIHVPPEGVVKGFWGGHLMACTKDRYE